MLERASVERKLAGRSEHASDVRVSTSWRAELPSRQSQRRRVDLDTSCFAPAASSTVFHKRQRCLAITAGRTVNTAPQRGHFPFLPANRSATANACWHPGHRTGIDMEQFPRVRTADRPDWANKLIVTQRN